MSGADTRKQSVVAENDDDKWMSLFAAEKELGEGRATILARAVNGEVRAKEVAGRMIVHIDDIAKVKQQKADAERPVRQSRR